MSHPIRIIPRLDIKGSNLVKGVNLEGLRVLGSSHEFAKYYYEQGADELFYQDVVDAWKPKHLWSKKGNKWELKHPIK